ncbi:hypothetical protein AX774_g5877 [Zancudomyces culisetae]|uniref:Uncharacterized protein n=1 Tax=Zancudomyces culisetae TaxID=1213189 RepID=A0A1R1PI81_ZANCU|nr:hypothetical protein AX774_g5877 [Zancudomyces culisetae]|eukprot:OMH80691.1 hypothetical protein AX774_g5877 [Zancudomyces culisetae]
MYTHPILPKNPSKKKEKKAVSAFEFRTKLPPLSKERGMTMGPTVHSSWCNGISDMQPTPLPIPILWHYVWQLGLLII